MFEEFVKFKGLHILEHFLENPNKITNILGLSKDLRISTMTAKQYIDYFLKDNILINKNERNSKTVMLNNKNIIVKELKKVYILDKFKQLNVEKIINNPFYLYGSFSAGEYNKNSDIDLFIIKKKEYNKDALRKIGAKMGHEIRAIDVIFYDLNKYKQKHAEFVLEIKKGFFFGDEINEL